MRALIKSGDVEKIVFFAGEGGCMHTQLVHVAYPACWPMMAMQTHTWKVAHESGVEPAQHPA